MTTNPERDAEAALAAAPRLLALVAAHEACRGDCVNLVAAENVISVSTRRLRILVFVLSSLMAAAGGVVFTSQVGIAESQTGAVSGTTDGAQAGLDNAANPPVEDLAP